MAPADSHADFYLMLAFLWPSFMALAMTAVALVGTYIHDLTRQFRLNQQEYLDFPWARTFQKPDPRSIREALSRDPWRRRGI